MSSGAKDSAGYASMMFEALLRMIPKLQEYIARYRGDGGEMDPAMLLQAILHRVPDLHHADKRHIRELLAARNSICHNRDVSSAADFASFEMSVTCVMSFVTQKVGRDDGFNAFMEALHNEANGGPTRTRVHPQAPSRRGSQPVKIVEKRVEVPVYMTALGPDPDKPRMVGKCQQFSPQGEHAETQTVRDLEEASTQTELLVEPVSTLRTHELSRRVVKTAMCDLLRQKLKEKPPIVLAGSCVVCGESVDDREWACTRRGTKTPKSSCRDLLKQATVDASAARATKKAHDTRKVYLTGKAVAWLNSQMEK
ncbi:hypothetical protein J8273_8735 [Carpediemonas membranifera]|uniref:Uncharacterized protein n=1 Tax=Carpediemonas membranifera TaxID=201153 RepID=A0A8J6APG2_9EUKA|nr:hypothetical protein J8273_8735 [Carpediemonas membranifera]|eukprot:KAG9389443.1 hypothetical protein J8273_8735 [Carpediemonas membranifera]